MPPAQWRAQPTVGAGTPANDGPSRHRCRPRRRASSRAARTSIPAARPAAVHLITTSATHPVAPEESPFACIDAGTVAHSSGARAAEGLSFYDTLKCRDVQAHRRGRPDRIQSPHTLGCLPKRHPHVPTGTNDPEILVTLCACSSTCNHSANRIGTCSPHQRPPSRTLPSRSPLARSRYPARGRSPRSCAARPNERLVACTARACPRGGTASEVVEITDSDSAPWSR